MSTVVIPTIKKHNTYERYSLAECNAKPEEKLSEIMMEKFIALNPLYYMDEEEEDENSNSGFHPENSLNDYKQN